MVNVTKGTTPSKYTMYKILYNVPYPGIGHNYTGFTVRSELKLIQTGRKEHLDPRDSIGITFFVVPSFERKDVGR